jgi:hypothetical protein
MNIPAMTLFKAPVKNDPSLVQVLEELRGLRQHVTTAEGAQRLSAAEQLVSMQCRVCLLSKLVMYCDMHL